jgi:ketosteroid isomerase-like protein
MSQENVQVARQAIDAFNRRDLDALRALNDPGVELDFSASRGVDATVYRGIEAVLSFWMTYFEVFDEIVIRPDRFMDAGESVVIPNQSRSIGRDGIEVFARSAFVMTMRSHKVKRICLYQETEQALKAVGPKDHASG